PPNSVMLEFLEKQYNMNISFLDWMLMGVPFAIVLLAINYLVIVKIMYPNRLGKLSASAAVIDQELAKLGPMRKPEKLVLGIFLLTAFLWITRSFLNQWIPGLSDTGISVIAAILMFVVPLRFAEGKFSLDWQDTTRLPWGILLLFGGGLALANGMAKSGIIDLIGSSIAQQEGLSIFVITSLLIFVTLFMTELMSNVALVAIFIPVIAGIAIGLDSPILHMVIPVTLASSCAFMLPMSTPPNAIVFASGHIRVYQMARAGILLNIISVLLLIALTYSLIPILF
ncbi:MAG: SLC13 family permease, partial [Bacteroidota bacterium]